MNTAQPLNNIIPFKGELGSTTVINMSQRLQWAKRQSTGSGATKSILRALSEYANDALEAWPCVAELSETTEFNRKTVMASLNKLVELGLIIDTGKRVGHTKQVIVYRLNVHNEPVNSPKSGTVKQSNSPKSGTLSTPETVPNLPSNSTVFSSNSTTFSSNSPKSGTRNRQEPTRTTTEPQNPDLPVSKNEPLGCGGDFCDFVFEEKTKPLQAELESVLKSNTVPVTNAQRQQCLDLLNHDLQTGKPIPKPAGYLVGLLKRANAGTLDTSALESAPNPATTHPQQPQRHRLNELATALTGHKAVANAAGYTTIKAWAEATRQATALAELAEYQALEAAIKAGEVQA